MVDWFTVIIGDSSGPAMATLALWLQPVIPIEAPRRLDVLPQLAVMIGNSGVDVRAARAAGVAAIAVRGGYSSGPLETFSPDVIIDTIGVVPAHFALG